MVTTPIRTRASRTLRPLVTPFRLQFAAKTAAAAAVAWWLAPFVPFAADEYSYYAPLGVVVSMYPTLADSARSGVQTLVGLAAGIGLGLAAVASGAVGVPAIAALALVVAIGTILGGLRVLGPGKEWIAMAALFVLLIGGRSDADTFSFSYLVTMAFGMLVGIVVNVAVAPPLFLRDADRRLSMLRDDLASRLEDMAAAIEQREVDTAWLEEAMLALTTSLADVADEVGEAARSGRGNPRARRHHAVAESNTRRLRALERATFFTRDLADVLSRVDADDPALQEPSRSALVEAIRACRDLLATHPGAPESTERLHAAERAVEAFLDGLDPARQSLSGLAETATAGACLRRIVDACRPFV